MSATRDEHYEEYEIRIDDEPNNFTMIPNIINLMGLSVQARALYVYLKYRAGETGQCFENSKNIAKNMDMSNGSITKAKNELDMFGLIDIEHKNTGRGKASHRITIVNIWTINRIVMASKNPEKKAYAMSVRDALEVGIRCMKDDNENDVQ